MQSISLKKKRVIFNPNYLSRPLSIILIVLILSACDGQVTLPPPNTGNSSQVEVNESSTETETVAEPIFLNNCGNSSPSEQISEHSQSISIEGGAQIGAGIEIIQASVEAKYVTTKGITKSQKVVASPGTNMKFVLLWTEQVNQGTVTINNQSSQTSYRVTVPISVEQASAEDLGCHDGSSAQPSSDSTTSNNSNPTTSPTIFIPTNTVVPTSMSMATPKPYYDQGESVVLKDGISMYLNENFLNPGGPCGYPKVGFGVELVINNTINQQYMIRFNSSNFHATDNLGTKYKLVAIGNNGDGFCDDPIGVPSQYTMSWGYWTSYIPMLFEGQIPLQATYILITADWISGIGPTVFKKYIN